MDIPCITTIQSDSENRAIAPAGLPRPLTPGYFNCFLQMVTMPAQGFVHICFAQ